jgi:hypothetical protein
VQHFTEFEFQEYPASSMMGTASAHQLQAETLNLPRMCIQKKLRHTYPMQHSHKLTVTGLAIHNGHD